MPAGLSILHERGKGKARGPQGPLRASPPLVSLGPFVLGLETHLVPLSQAPPSQGESRSSARRRGPHRVPDPRFDPVPAKAVDSAQGASGGLHCYPLGTKCVAALLQACKGLSTPRAIHPLAEACAAPVKRAPLRAWPGRSHNSAPKAARMRRVDSQPSPLTKGAVVRLSSSPFAA